MNRMYLTFFAGLIFCTGICRAGDAKAYTLEDDFTDLKAAFDAIVPEKGITESQANLLAMLYFARYDGGCGFAEPVTRQGKFWVAETLVGPQGADGGDIRIYAANGWIMQRGLRFPLCKAPWTELKSILVQTVPSGMAGNASPSPVVDKPPVVTPAVR